MLERRAADLVIIFVTTTSVVATPKNMFLQRLSSLFYHISIDVSKDYPGFAYEIGRSAVPMQIKVQSR